jgi:hypothetical protein
VLFFNNVVIECPSQTLHTQFQKAVKWQGMIMGWYGFGRKQSLPFLCTIPAFAWRDLGKP